MNGGWDDITKAELTELAKELTDRMIADKYGVTVGQVRYKRKKYGISGGAILKRALQRIGCWTESISIRWPRRLRNTLSGAVRSKTCMRKAGLRMKI